MVRGFNGSVIPESRHPAKGITVDGHSANGRERQVRGDKQFAARSGVLHQADPNTYRFCIGVIEYLSRVKGQSRLS